MVVRTLAPLLACITASAFELWLGATHGQAPAGQRAVCLAIGLLFGVSAAAARLLRPQSRIDVGLSAMSLAEIAADINTGLQLPTAMPGRALTVLVGVPASWLQIPIVFHLILSYPTGRIDRRGELLLVRVAASAAATIAALLLLTKSPIPLCADWCGPSPLRVVDDVALYLGLRGAGLLVMLALSAGGLILLLRRTVDSPRQRRRSFVTSAIAVSAAVLFAGVVADLVASYLDGGRAATWDANLSLALGGVLVGALPLFFLVGLVRQWLAFATVGQVLAGVKKLGADEVEATLARAVGDPRLRIAYRDEGGWRDAEGRHYVLPDATAGLAVQMVGEPPRAALVHAPALAEEPGLLNSALSLVDVAFPPPYDQKPESEPMPYAFVSYLHEDSATVDRLVAALRGHGIEVWLDRTHLVVGDHWPHVVKAAIRDGTFFIACFSAAYARRSRTHMNEELVTAVDELRLRPRDRRWFLPVMLEPCKVPTLDLGAGETLASLHHVDLSQDWDAAVHQLVRAIAPGP